MSFEEEVKKGYIYYAEEPKPCGQCTKMTNWIDICLYTFMCSKECEKEWCAGMSDILSDSK